MATIGLRDLYRAAITEAAGVETYGTPTRMAKAISAELSVEVAEAPLYADDAIDAIVKEFVSGELTLNVNDLLPADLAALLGQTQDDDNVVYAGENDAPPYFAIGFKAKKADGTYKYIWLYKVKFGIPDESYTTKGDSIEFSTPTIVGTIVKRPDGLWKAEHVGGATGDTVAAAWFTAVREPNNE
ncbi:Phage major tail protein phi13 [Dehalobacter sp. UNSWDHB]|uniref:major tail protein n=1 Tax=Dehalobacter sp. UNSWDHB TaxID=1339256 RepID=UPI0003877477|nr:major tail protein [Dehalobacter sp. UNSWDHB]EQB20086.1 Phage major tail protein phi13 [Dehalobacter sp. UNSWDHB]